MLLLYIRVKSSINQKKIKNNEVFVFDHCYIKNIFSNFIVKSMYLVYIILLTCNFNRLI